MAIFENLQQKLQEAVQSSHDDSAAKRTEYVQTLKNQVQEHIEKFIMDNFFPAPSTATALEIVVTGVALRDGLFYAYIEGHYSASNETWRKGSVDLFEFSGSMNESDKRPSLEPNKHEISIEYASSYYLWDLEHPEFQKITISEIFENCFSMKIPVA